VERCASGEPWVMRRHLVFVGLPGSGKSAVGRAVAEGLNVPLIDVDSLLVREMGMPVARIFGMLGEAKFRQMEREAVRTARAREACVIVPGGGWAAQPGELEDAKTDSLIVYLKVPVQTAVKRTGGGEVRPVLAGNPTEQMRCLLAAREPFYRLADYVVEADTKPVDQLALAVIGLARTHGGWS
jgi:shikimate kinase